MRLSAASAHVAWSFILPSKVDNPCVVLGVHFDRAQHLRFSAAPTEPLTQPGRIARPDKIDKSSRHFLPKIGVDRGTPALDASISMMQAASLEGL